MNSVRFGMCFEVVLGVFSLIYELNLLYEMTTGGSSTSISGGNQVDGLPPVPVILRQLPTS